MGEHFGCWCNAFRRGAVHITRTFLGFNRPARAPKSQALCAAYRQTCQIGTDLCLISPASSTALPVIAAMSKSLNPNISSIRCLIRPWFCSIMLFNYFLEHSPTRRGVVRADFTSVFARCDAASASSVITRGAHCSSAPC